MENLKEILSNINSIETIFQNELNVEGIAIDSRLVESNFLFIAIKGFQSDGHNFIGKAIEKGANTIVYQSEIDQQLIQNNKVNFVKVKDSAEAAGRISSNFFHNPSEKIKLVGITGTNGKTTTATLLYQLFRALGYKTGLISTVHNLINDEIIPSSHTTPDPIQLNKLLAEMVEAGCDIAFMEVSSHAVDQKRIAGLQFDGGVFTNITHDHLDYHKTFDAYIKAKKQFFDELPSNAFALVNKDDKRGMVMLQNCEAKHYSFALYSTASFKVKILENNIEGLHLNLDNHDFHASLIGDFNAYNLLTVYAVAVLLGNDKNQILRELSTLKGAEGRFDYIKNKKNTIGIVDYAHTPDALEKVLLTISELKKSDTKVITVVGCGGDRDKSKRPIMTKIACELSNHVILTSDNPRTEDPSKIIEEMLVNQNPVNKKKIIINENRKQAIITACNLANENDIILIAGKGHEKYQEINGVKHPFDDKLELNLALMEE